ncbi:Ketohexokinase [Parachaetomium inaequale]|uniref:Ketohexokinase n=1 Tax=Parachaetomium inaequale TaxID=2588326 RepID=A0AAN6PH41_9PEZI|nr:Ketohexokinase [Parachaetomium inaequale]
MTKRQFTPFNPTLHPPNAATAQAAYAAAERDALQATTPPPTSISPDSTTTTPLTNTPTPTALTITPHEIAIKRARSAKARLATAHEAWLLAAQTLVRGDVVPRVPAAAGDDKEGAVIAGELQDFGDAICERYAAATFLWNVLGDMPVMDWFGSGEGKFDATLRRLKTLQGLEECLGLWEGVMLELVEVVDDEKGTRSVGEVRAAVGRVLGKWRGEGRVRCEK